MCCIFSPFINFIFLLYKNFEYSSLVTAGRRICRFESDAGEEAPLPANEVGGGHR
jgi:hypothetical protein